MRVVSTGVSFVFVVSSVFDRSSMFDMSIVLDVMAADGRITGMRSSAGILLYHLGRAWGMLGSEGGGRLQRVS